MARLRVVVGLVVVAGMALSACGPSRAALGKQYLGIVGPVNQVIYKIDTNKAPTDTIKAVQARFHPAAVALIGADTALLTLKVPSEMDHAVHALVRADSAFASQVSALRVTTVSTFSAWLSKTTQIIGQMSAAATILRADLHLPPPPHLTAHGHYL